MIYPKRLIEVDLPIKRISSHARREKDMRRGHIPLLHIYPAARPTSACRAVYCAMIWPDPADPLTPATFVETAATEMAEFARLTQSRPELAAICDTESWQRFMGLSRQRLNAKDAEDRLALRQHLLDFIAAFASWEGGEHPDLLDTARRLVTAAIHRDGAGAPVAFDSFAGGGAIPLEGIRLGLDVFASDMNSVALLINKVILEDLPRHGDALVAEVEDSFDWLKRVLHKELARCYPPSGDGSTPIAYIWARTVSCEGPGCGTTVPLLRSNWLVKKKGKSVALIPVVDEKAKRIQFKVATNPSPTTVPPGTVRKGSVTCPVCTYTTPVQSVRRQLKERNGGASDAQLVAVAQTSPVERGRSYREPKPSDLDGLKAARKMLEADKVQELLPSQRIPFTEIRRINVPLYGMARWQDLFTDRQLVFLTAVVRAIRERHRHLRKASPEIADAVTRCMSLLLGKMADMSSSLCVWQGHAEIPAHLFGRWAIGMVFDFAETNPLAGSSGSPEASGTRLLDGLRQALGAGGGAGHVIRANAMQHPLPDDSADIMFVDPPYYDAIPYAHLMDYFHVWFRQCLDEVHHDWFADPEIDKTHEIVVDRPHELSKSTKDVAFYEASLSKAFADGRRVLRPDGVAAVVFASKTTASWEAILQAIVDAGWIITASWPIDTEMQSRVAAQGQARLASSVHLVCRPRENRDGKRIALVGDWRDVLAELPQRIRVWMDRLQEEGVVGADAIFSCLGPALEIFSRFSKVEKANGEPVTLREYLPHVWGAVSQQALNQVFKGADAAGFEEDARLTAMWLWTLNAGTSANGEAGQKTADDDHIAGDGDDDAAASDDSKTAAYALEFDAARKIAQGLGAHLDDLSSVVEVKGDKARLLGVSERTRRLFGKDEAQAPKGKRKPKEKQMRLFSLEDVENEDGGWGDKSVPKLGQTVLDRVHQSMILFAAGRSEALKRFLVEDAAGDQRFWKLAQALSALYPAATDEKRWVDGVLARKRSLGF